jgi:hypothetical protein
MDALNMAAVGASSAPGGSQRSSILERAEKRLPARIWAALSILLEDFHYARDLDANLWDFATEIGSLRRLNLSNGDLRWLVRRGLMEHGVEVTLGGDAQRSFQHPLRLMLSKRTCFVLSPAGAEMAGGRCPAIDDSLAGAKARPASAKPALAIATPPGPQLPKWDRDRHELRVGSTLVKRYKIPSDNEETILTAFEELNWPVRIDDPLPPCHEPSPSGRLQETVELLNRNQKQPMIRFLKDGAGRGVLWEFSTELSA